MIQAIRNARLHCCQIRMARLRLAQRALVYILFFSYSFCICSGGPWIVLCTHHHSNLELWGTLIDSAGKPIQFSGTCSGIHHPEARGGAGGMQ